MLSTALLLTCLVNSPAPSIDQAFANPPAWAKPHTWWHWMAGNVTKEGITADLESMKYAGIGGAHIFDAGQGIPTGPIKYNSPEWRALMAHAMSEAQRLGLDMTMHNCSGWSSSGGPWVTPEDAMKKTTFRIEYFDGPGLPPSVPQPPTVGGYYKDIATIAIPNVEGKFNRDRQNDLIGLGGNPGQDADLNWPVVPKNKVVVLTGNPDPRLDSGKWIIVRLGYTLTGAHNVASRPTGEGLEVDKLSTKSLDRFLEGGLVPLFKSIGLPVGKAFKTVLIDSYETGFQNWTPTMAADFKRLRGYDPTPYLPTLAGYAVGDKATTLKFLFDYRRTIADLWAENYSGHFANRLAKYGLRLAVEPYGNGNFDPFTYGKPAGLIMGEYWVGEGTINSSTKQAASVAHIYGQSVVGAESLTASPEQAGWRNQPRQWKPFADRGYTYGINRIIYHRFAHQPWVSGVVPGMTMGPWGSHVDRTETFWSFMPEWDLYLARCQYMLQSGKFVGDICLFSGEGSPQEYIGEGYDLGTIPAGYDFDYCGLDPLLSMKVVNGRLVTPNGPTYRLLKLPNTNQMSVNLARKIRQLVKDGAIVVGPKPTGSPSLADGPEGNREVAAIGNEVWGSNPVGKHVYGKGAVYAGLDLEAALPRIGIKPDVSFGAKKLRTIHRSIGSTDAYFVASALPTPRTVSMTFRVTGRVPELWDAETGKTQVAAVWRNTPSGVQVDVPLEGDGSVFVVFRKPSNGLNPIVDLRIAGSGVPKPQAGPKPVVLNAEYGVLDHPGQFADVTRIVQGFIDGGEPQIEASNDAMGGDPAADIVKSLRVTYKLNGVTKTIVVAENASALIGKAVPMPPAPPVTATSDTLTIWKNCAVRLTRANGKSKVISQKQLPAPLTVKGTWQVSFPAGWDAPARTVFPTLESWTDSDVFGIKYFSGTASYTKTLTVPAAWVGSGKVLSLDLGDVREMARVKVNGKLVATLWKAPFRVDVTGLVHPGNNVLQVDVTNLWVNRLVGDEQFPDDMGWNGDQLKGWPEWFVKHQPRPEPRRKTFTTWHHNKKDTPLLRSGLMGPVTLTQGIRVSTGK